jgi:hypothetical protein
MKKIEYDEGVQSRAIKESILRQFWEVYQRRCKELNIPLPDYDLEQHIERLKLQNRLITA